MITKIDDSCKDILLVDDDDIYLRLFTKLINKQGLSVSCAASGTEAIEKLSHNTYCLMVTDYNMSGMDGLELVQRAALIAPHMSVIMITGNTSEELPELAAKSGVIKVFQKTFDAQDILSAILDSYKSLKRA